MERHRKAREGTVWTSRLPSSHGFHIDGGEVLPRQSTVQVSPGITKLTLNYLVTKTNRESPWCEEQKEEAAQAESCAGSSISMREIRLEISVFRHRHVRQTDQCLDEDEKSCWKVSPDLSFQQFTFIYQYLDPRHLINFPNHFGGGPSTSWPMSTVCGLWQINPGSGTPSSVGTDTPTIL